MTISLQTFAEIKDEFPDTDQIEKDFKEIQLYRDLKDFKQKKEEFDVFLQVVVDLKKMTDEICDKATNELRSLPSDFRIKSPLEAKTKIIELTKMMVEGYLVTINKLTEYENSTNPYIAKFAKLNIDFNKLLVQSLALRVTDMVMDNEGIRIQIKKNENLIELKSAEISSFFELIKKELEYFKKRFNNI